MFIIIRNHLLLFVEAHFTSRMISFRYRASEGGGFARKRNLDSALCQHRNTQKEEEVLCCLRCSPDLRLIGLHLRYNSCPTFHPRAFFFNPRHRFTLVFPSFFAHSHDFNVRLRLPTTPNNCQSFKQKLLHEVSGGEKVPIPCRVGFYFTFSFSFYAR